ncbi:MAG: L-glutamate gamma-semialdehyde dehydrogenase [Bacteroidales bacterium]|nr:L-glutamate gamma-semialdehyde dehydrogenase [Bacteroidales bacterium]
MNNAIFSFPHPANEPIKSYAPGSAERNELKAKIEELKNNPIEIPLIIGGKEVRTGNTGKVVMPTNHGHVLATYHNAGPEEVQMAIDAAMEARKIWSEMPWVERASITLKAAELIATKYRATLNAATMLGQGKNPFQAEIDSACETIDFLRFNAHYASQIYAQQPSSSPGVINRMEYRALEGFVFALSPFNFTAIASNLNMSPVLMGNVTVWKPATTAILSNYYLMKIFEEAGLPAGVINFVPGKGSTIGKVIFDSPNLGGIHFTGSTNTFQQFWKIIGNTMTRYKSYPRIVGETGGKDFIFAHKSADVKALATAITRGAFEYQGQKCSAASRAYIPNSIWPAVEKFVKADVADFTMGCVTEFSHFMNAVIDESAFDSIANYIEMAKSSDKAEIVVGGAYDKSVGYFIEPTVIKVTDPHFVTMEEEIFGPVITVYVYDDEAYEETLELCDQTSPYALTGAIFSQDRYELLKGYNALRNSAGNFYLNDKPTGAVVDQQPFGGGRGSGTNDKAGSYLNLIRWTNPRTVKETLVPPVNYRYPFLDKE